MARGRSADYDLNRESIVRTATRLFAQQGYPGTSMSDLAKACGISKPLLYHYVSDKYELLREITDGHVTRLEALVGEVEALKLAPPARLRELIRRFVHEYAQARHDHGVLTQDVKFLEPRDRNRVLRKERAVVAAFAATIAEARPDLAQAALAKPLTMLLFGMINWMFTWLKPEGTLGHDDMAPIVADLFLGGLGAVQAPATTVLAPN
ncbi:TetR/AcrR family transcriptional regulator [Variovorax sp. YR752]|uniref:TetR/AcrR family transcriptional regulator n=1 Tax=Variovorax sp. YR752 TaxID=1884383 RepID=UPI003137C502